MTTLAAKQDYTKVSKHWPNPYEDSAVYVPLVELVHAYEYLNKTVPTLRNGDLCMTEDFLIDSWTDSGQFLVDAYIVPQLNSYSAGVRYGADAKVLTPNCNPKMLEALYNKYCPKALSCCNQAEARLKWHFETEGAVRHELRFDIEKDGRVVQFNANAMVDLLFKTNPTYAERLVAQARKSCGTD